MNKTSRRKRAPFDPAYSRYLLRKAGKKQVDLARELNISRVAVTIYLDDRGYSQRFWDHFYKTISGVQDVA